MNLLSSLFFLARISNSPTVLSNVLVGLALSGKDFHLQEYLLLSLIFILFYVGGMFLNDCCDYREDCRVRPERPLPSGKIQLGVARFLTCLLLFSAIWLLGWSYPQALPFGLLLLFCITLYDFWHKKNPLAPLLMGGCRALVYLSTVAALQAPLLLIHLLFSLTLACYVSGLSQAARIRDGRYIGTLVAGICLLDMGILCYLNRWDLAFSALALFFLTLFFQRVVPGH